jgi:PAS domain S-box-containing protein
MPLIRLPPVEICDMITGPASPGPPVSADLTDPTDAGKLVRLAALRAEVRALERELDLVRPPQPLPRDFMPDEAIYALIMQYSSEFISIHGPDGRYLFASPACEQLLGYSPSEMIGLDPYGLLHPDDIPAVAASHATQKVGEPRVDEARLRHKDGSYVWVATLSSARVVDGAVEQIICCTRNISARRRAEEQQQELVRRLDAFASVAAHDLKAPLQAISGLIDVVRWGAGDRLNPDELSLLDRAVARAVRLGSLVDGILLFSRMEDQRLVVEPVDLNVLTRNALADVGPELQDLAASVEVAPELPTFAGDPLLLGALMRNLLVNALKYRSLDRPVRVEVRAHAQNGRFLLEVEDNGIGIDASDQGRVFEMFARADSARNRPGNGLGLALCRRIAQHHGGEISLQSRLGEGTTVQVDLPLG